MREVDDQVVIKLQKFQDVGKKEYCACLNLKACVFCGDLRDKPRYQIRGPYLLWVPFL